MARPSLVLYLDVVSPFAYLAFHVVRQLLFTCCEYIAFHVYDRFYNQNVGFSVPVAFGLQYFAFVHYADRWSRQTSSAFEQCDVRFVPVFLGGIMKACGNTPPANIKNKAEWVGKERLRWARAFNVPMANEMPSGFPRNTIQVQRALSAVELLHPERLTETFATLYHMSFVERKDIHTLDLIGLVFSKIFGETQAKEILTKATSDEVKKHLSARTEEALAEGSFGLPWFAAINAKGDKECYWGFDHLAQVVDHLGLERPQPSIISGRGWRAML